MLERRCFESRIYFLSARTLAPTRGKSPPAGVAALPNPVKNIADGRLPIADLVMRGAAVEVGLGGGFQFIGGFG